MWRRAMIGHAVSNCMPVIAANRIGEEDGQKFYGHSFIADEWGAFAAEADGRDNGALVATLDLAQARKHRAGMGFFRDRRRSEEHTSEIQSLMRTSYAVFCLKQKSNTITYIHNL